MSQLDLFGEDEEGALVLPGQVEIIPKIDEATLVAMYEEEQREIEAANKVAAETAVSLPKEVVALNAWLAAHPHSNLPSPEVANGHRLTVRPIYKESTVDGSQWTHSELRIRGKWLKQYFPPNTHVRIYEEQRGSKTVLIIESI